MRLRPVFIPALIVATSLGFTQVKSPFPTFPTITQASLRAHLEFIAHDLLEGRDTPSRGLDIAAEYLATQMKLAGLKPGGVKGTYFQPFPVKQARISESKSTLTVGSRAFTVFGGFIPSFGSGTAKGQVAFVGHGYVMPSKEMDPYKGIDVKGKLVLRVDMVPKEWSWDSYFSGKQPGSQTPEQAAQARGAIGMLTIRSSQAYDNWMVEANAVRARVAPSYGENSFAAAMINASLSKEAAQQLLDKEQVGFDQIQADLAKGIVGPSWLLTADKVVEISVGIHEETVMTKNVVAILPGADPKLAAEYVAIGAHYDHVGMAGPGPGDRIYNGADDDGSGTVAVLEIARALAAGPKLKRSVIFVWHAAEEKGLWGSDFFTKNPTVPIKSIVAQLNIDMIGRSKGASDKDPRNKDLSGPKHIYVIGSRKLSKELGDLVVDVNSKVHQLKLDYRYDDPKDPERFYERSDHYNYARYNIPIAFFFDGVHEDYHQVSDEAHKIDYRKMEMVTRTVATTAWTLANRGKRPALDKKPG